MGKVATTTTAPTRTAPNTGPNWRRIIRRLVTAGILSVAAAALAYERDKWLPPLLDHWLPDAYARVRGQPLAIQIGAAVFVLDMLLAAAIFVIRDQILRAREAAEAAQAEDERQRENVRIGVTEANAPEFAQVKAGQSAIRSDVHEVRDQMIALAGRFEAAAPPIPATVAAPGGLPRPASLLGRDNTLAALMRDLRDQDTPAPIGVFALHGMGGIGKTALAAEAVARLSEDRAAFPGGAAWISCEALHGAEGLAELWSRVARALGLSEIAALPDAADRRAALASALAARPRTLLALDNVEPALDAYAALDTLSGGGGGRIALLLTARQPVAADRLRAVALPPLPDPDAATLFTQRLAQADPTRPTAGDLPHIPALAAAVGGLPLALEQLAAYTGAQKRDLAALAADLARDGISAAAFRANPQRTLFGSFDRSWDVLPPRQQRLFAGLALLAGASFPRAAALALAPAAAAAVVVAEGEPADPEADTAALVTYALVEPLANDRLRLHPLLREYAAAKLRSLGPAVEAPLGDALLAYWLTYARAHPGYDSMDALEAEAPGLMGALEWAHEHERDRDVLALARASVFMLRTRGRRDEQLWMCLAAEGAANRLGDLSEKQFATHQLAVTLADVGRLAEARAGSERALALARHLGDPAAERAETHALAVLDANAGHLTEARAGYERALALAKQLGDPAAERTETHELAILDAQTGHLTEARAGYERALEIARQLGDPAAERAETHALAVLDARTGHLAEARAGYERALALARQLGDPAAERRETHALAVLDFQEGDLAGATARYEQALDLAQRLGDPAAEATELRNLGDTIRYLGETARARDLIWQALDHDQRLGNPYSVGKDYEFLARLDEQEGDTNAAIAHYREALRRFEQVQSPDAEDARAALRELGAEP